MSRHVSRHVSGHIPRHVYRDAQISCLATASASSIHVCAHLCAGLAWSIHRCTHLCTGSALFFDECAGRVLPVSGGIAEKTLGQADGFWNEASYFMPERGLIDPLGRMYIVDTQNNYIRRIDLGTNVVTTVAGMPGEEGSVTGQKGQSNGIGTKARPMTAIDPQVYREAVERGRRATEQWHQD